MPRRIPGSSAPFFGAHHDLAGHLLVFGIDVLLEPQFGNVGDSRNSGKWDLLKQQFVNEALSACVNDLILRVLDELATAVAAFVVLLAVVASAVFDHVL